jgi:hypothetical protein
MDEEFEVYMQTNVTSAVEGRETSKQRQTQTNQRYVRVLPALVVHPIFEAVLFVFLYWSRFKYLGLVQQLMMKTKDLLVFLKSSLRSCCRRHDCDEMRWM